MTPPKKQPAATEPPEEKTELVPVTKDGETIHVCPQQVEPHRLLGWLPVEDQA